MVATIQPEKVLKDLRELWAQLGREQEDAGGVLRACAMTLVVIGYYVWDVFNQFK